MDTDILIVGAGPTGLMLANWLARFGIDHVILDTKSGPTRESRAIVLQARSMEIYDQLGLVDEVRDRAVSASHFQPGFEHRPARTAVRIGALGAGLTPFPGLHIFEQSANEEVLLANLRRLTGRSSASDGDGSDGSDEDAVRWGTKIVGLEQHEDHVQVRLDSGQQLSARYVVGCDGSSSPVRELSGIGFSGKTNPDVFWVLDAAANGLRSDAVNIRFGSTRFVLTFPMAGLRQRLVGVMREEEPTLPTIRRDLRETFGITLDDVEWFSTYRVHYRVANAFAKGRVFLAGDAAHVHSPVGAQGMNTGLQDAHNLALKFAAVLAGAADEKSLDHYEFERRPVARRLVSATDRLFEGVTDGRANAVRLRRLLLPVLPVVVPALAGRLPIARRFVGYLGQVRIHYWRSEAERAAAGGKRDRVVGRRLPWTGSNYACLGDCTWQVHAYGSQRIDPSLLPPVIGSSHRFGSRADLGLPDGTVLLVRPDGFVAARADSQGGDAIGAQFEAVIREFDVFPDADSTLIRLGEPVAHPGT